MSREEETGGGPGRSTICEARSRLGVSPLVHLFKDVVRLCARQQENPQAFYKGLRLMAIDGFTLDIPDMPANDKAFGRPQNGKGAGAFPQVQVLALMEAGTHVFWRLVIKGAHAAETDMARPLMRHLDSGMLLLQDRGFASFDLVRLVMAQKAQLLARWKINRILEPIKVLADGSYLACLYENEKDRRKKANGIMVRVIEYTLDEKARAGHMEKHRLITTLLDEHEHAAQTLVELYHVRWEQELAIDECKTHQLERPVLRSQTPAGVVQEVYGLMLGHYVLRVLMCQAAVGAKVPPTRISFTGTLKILRCRLPECPASPLGRQVWWQRLLEEISEEQLPPRRNRINPRVIKRQQSPWLTKRHYHRLWPQPTLPFIESIVIRH